MPEQTHEWIVRWKRRGRHARSQLFQTEKAARDKAARMIDIDRMVANPDQDELHEAGLGHLGFQRQDGTRMREDYQPLPPMIEPPTIERRAVGAWETA